MKSIFARKRNESGLAPTIELLIYIPLAFMFVGFILNSAFHWSTYFYMQGVVNNAASYTAAAGGNVVIPYIPNGGYNKTPTQYIADRAAVTPFVRSLTSTECFLVDDPSGVSNISRCRAVYRTLVIPTDPITANSFGRDITVIAEDIAQGPCNRNVTCL